MADDLRPPTRGLLSPNPVQPVNADALLNALVDLLVSQSQLASLVQDVTDTFMQSEDYEAQRVGMDARMKLSDVAISLDRATAAIRALQQDVK